MMRRARIGFALLTALLACAVTTSATAFDATGLKTVPAIDVAELTTHHDRTVLEVSSLRSGSWDEQLKATLATIAAYPEKVRRLFWLVYCADELGDGHDDTHQVLHVFFMLWGGDYAPEIEAAMREAGFADRARVFAAAMATFGTPYQRSSEVRYQHSGWTTESKDFNGFDLRLIALGTAFGTKAAFERAVDAYIRSDPELSAWCDAARASLSDRDRLVNLVTRLDAMAGSRDPAVFLKWPEPYRTLQILEIGLLELVNGGAEQFFGNFSGGTAPEAVTAYRTIGLPASADAVAKGIGYFPSPYPRMSEDRRAAEERDPKLSDKLDALTEAISAHATSEGQIAYATREGVLPR